MNITIKMFYIPYDKDWLCLFHELYIQIAIYVFIIFIFNSDSHVSVHIISSKNQIIFRNYNMHCYSQMDDIIIQGVEVVDRFTILVEGKSL